MRVAVWGAGSIGGWIAARLVQAGHDVTIIARGATLAALRSNGLTLIAQDGTIHTRPAVVERPEEAGRCDVVIVAVKAFALTEIAPLAVGLLASGGIIVPMLNGVPWWFMGDGMPLDSVDPGGVIAASIPIEQVVACVVHAAALRDGPDTVRLIHGKRLVLGEPGGGISDRVDQLAALLRAANLPGEACADVRSEIWYKLWGNMTMNPISALTLATADRILDDPLVLGLVTAVMEEAREIGRRIGCPISESAAARNAVTRQLGVFRTSMLQDVDAGRRLELGALLAAPREIAARLGIATPSIDALLGLARVMAQSRGLS